MRNKPYIKRKFNILENIESENINYIYEENNLRMILIVKMIHQPHYIIANCINHFIKLKCFKCNELLCKCNGYFEQLINFHKDLTQYAIIHNIPMTDNDIYSNANLKQIAHIILDNNDILALWY